MSDILNSAVKPGAPISVAARKLLIPRSDAALLEVARANAAAWAAEPTLTLRWLTQAAFAEAVAAFEQQLSGQRAAAANRSPQVQRLDELDEQLNEGLRFLKAYVLEEARSKAATEAQYPGYGLQRRKKGGFSLPADRGERLEALKTLVAKVQSAGFAGRPFGTAYWAPRAAEYAALMQETGALAGTVAQQTGNKNESKRTVRKALKALVLLIEANFPDTYQAELQRWGFRRTTY